MKMPTTQELSDQYLTSLEGSVAQTSPLHDKAFLRVLAVMLALSHTSLYKYAAERAIQNLALTAKGADLDRVGASAPGGVFRKLAEYAIITVSIDAVTGVTIPITTSFIGDLNGVRYTINAAAIAADGSATLELTASTVGTEGNLQIADTLTIVSPLPGVTATATVTGIVNVGAEDESDDEYRVRVLFAERSVKGGGNATDYRTWAEEVAGVVRAYPYAGKPVGSVDTPYPGDRTVYVQADSTLDADGVPSVGLLAEVRAALNIDPSTGISRPGLGLTDSTLYVQAISRTAVAITITNLVAPAGTEADVRAALEAAVNVFLRLFAPYVEGVDLPQDRNDKVTTLALSTALQSVFDITGSSAAMVAFSVGGVAHNSYQLSAGELVKLGVVAYATV